jgi:eukaryotic-like serine/threonine-protein kinase
MSGHTFAHYCLLRSLGSGATGEVFHAEDLSDSRHVALKLLRPDVSSDLHAIERLKREARGAAALHHPHISAVRDVDEYAGQHFIVMELLDGQSLREAFLAGPMDRGTILEVALQAAGALAAAHVAGLVHRRLKPANVFVTRAGQVKLLDFGLPSLSAMPDDPGYVTPEEILRQELDGRSDLFGLGVVLHEIATGRRLFAGGSQKQVFDAVLHQPVPAVTHLNPRLPAGLEWILHRALEKKRSRRYQSAAELLGDLEGLKRAEVLASAG